MIHQYILDCDQPTWCPKCGARTDFEEYKENEEIEQLHKCLNTDCAFEFIGVFECEEEHR